MTNFLLRWSMFSLEQKIACTWLALLVLCMVVGLIWACFQSPAFGFVVGGFLVYASIFWAFYTLLGR